MVDVRVCLHSSMIVTSSRVHGEEISGEDRVDLKLVALIISRNTRVTLYLHILQYKLG